MAAPALRVVQQESQTAQTDTAPKWLFLVTEQDPIQRLEWYWRWVIRYIYAKTDWSCANWSSLRYIGVYDDEAEAYHAARFPGGSVIKIPFNGSLPLGQVWSGQDFPLSDISKWYRDREPDVVLPAEMFNTIRHQINTLTESLSGIKTK